MNQLLHYLFLIYLISALSVAGLLLWAFEEIVQEMALDRLVVTRTQHAEVIVFFLILILVPVLNTFCLIAGLQIVWFQIQRR